MNKCLIVKNLRTSWGFTGSIIHFFIQWEFLSSSKPACHICSEISQVVIKYVLSQHIETKHRASLRNHVHWNPNWGHRKYTVLTESNPTLAGQVNTHFPQWTTQSREWRIQGEEREEEEAVKLFIKMYWKSLLWNWLRVLRCETACKKLVFYFLMQPLFNIPQEMDIC